MEHLEGQTLVKKNKEKVSADEVLSDKEIVAFYYSAHWCPPCRAFTPILADFYREVKAKGLPLEIIFVSSDDTEEEFFNYMNECHGDWFAVPFESPAAEKLDDLKQQLGEDGIPTLVVMKKDGTILSRDGIDAVEKEGVDAYSIWEKKGCM